MKYGKSLGEKEFGTSAVIAILILFACFIVHSAMKCLRFRNTDWLPHVDSPKLPDGIKLFVNMIERDLAPSILCLAFQISVGGCYFPSILLIIIIFVLGSIQFMSYRRENYKTIAATRIMIVTLTCILYIMLLANDHVFNDTTLPQLIEMHMTTPAMMRHGAKGHHVDNVSRVYNELGSRDYDRKYDDPAIHIHANLSNGN